MQTNIVACPRTYRRWQIRNKAAFRRELVDATLLSIDTG
jgi:hypothetical protein